MHFVINSLKKAVSKVAQTGTEITTPNSYCEMFYTRGGIHQLNPVDC